ncbi:hypothetical protein FWH30_01220 [Microgenomates group bacterium]|nr:hypothetical protein [Microgenomates group bacterium]
MFPDPEMLKLLETVSPYVIRDSRGDSTGIRDDATAKVKKAWEELKRIEREIEGDFEED